MGIITYRHCRFKRIVNYNAYRSFIFSLSHLLLVSSLFFFSCEFVILGLFGIT